MKRVILLAVLLALALYAAPAGAIDETLLEGLPVTEDYITYEVIGNTVTIRYYASPEVHAVIPSQINGLTVTAIGDFAFSNCEISSVTIPETVTTIGAGAFEHCYGLSEITIPSSVLLPRLNNGQITRRKLSSSF